MTPMLVVMLAIGTTDVLFALDSIPAIFGLTQDPYIVFTANAFALMGLRQLYFLIGGLLKKLVHLSYGLSVILGFIGVKLVLHALHEAGVHVPEISIPVSLGVIVAVLAVTTVTSLMASRRAAPDGADAEGGGEAGGGTGRTGAGRARTRSRTRATWTCDRDRPSGVTWRGPPLRTGPGGRGLAWTAVGGRSTRKARMWRARRAPRRCPS